MAEEVPNKPEKIDQDFRDQPQKNNPKADKTKTGDGGGCGC